MNEFKIKFNRKEYRTEYLQTEHWKNKSKEIRTRDPICRICNKNSTDDVHHLTYENIYNEKDTDLIGICRECHEKVHKFVLLEESSTLADLKKNLLKIKEIIELDALIVDKMNNLKVNGKKKICSVLKIQNIEFFDSLVGKKISNNKWLKIKQIIDKYKISTEYMRENKSNQGYRMAHNKEPSNRIISNIRVKHWRLR